jgi:hypothetical protein
MCHYFLPQFSNTLTHSSHLATSLKTLSRYKFGSCIQNHSWADTSTSSLWNQRFPKCCFSDQHKLCVMKCDPLAQCIIPTQHMSRHKSCCTCFIATPGPVIFETPGTTGTTGTTHPTTGCHIPEDFLTLLQNLIHTRLSVCTLQGCYRTVQILQHNFVCSLHPHSQSLL